ncbi:MAG TPA: S-methyl-5'-thioadenosine phosphorylase [Phycisphaerae bacterium]|nr:S-methyl-5'-thioadenosine phosphorylase [Phycisphaerae bacterium]
MAASVIGLIGGTGLGEVLLREVKGKAVEVDTPFGRPSAPIVRAQWEGAEVAFLARHGPGHSIGPTAVPYRANIYALKAVGVTHIVASGATGSLREEFRPRDLVVPDQIIDKTSRRPASFFDEPGIVVHVEFAQPFCPALRKLLLSAGESTAVTVHDGGTYVCVEGPSFSTVAESRMHRSWGGDLVGMTCMPEARLAREAEMCYALIALPTDYDCWRPHDPSVDKGALLTEIIGNVEHATANSVVLIRAALRSMAGRELPPCECRKSLDLAIWTNRQHVRRETVERFGVLLARHFKDGPTHA